MRLELNPPPHALTAGTSKFHLFNYAALLAPELLTDVHKSTGSATVISSKRSKRSFDVGEYDFEDPFIDDGEGRNMDAVHGNIHTPSLPSASEYFIEEIRRPSIKKRSPTEESKPQHLNEKANQQVLQESKDKTKHKTPKGFPQNQASGGSAGNSKNHKHLGASKIASSKMTKVKNTKTKSSKQKVGAIPTSTPPSGQTKAIEGNLEASSLASKTVTQMLQESAFGVLGAFEQRWGSNTSITGPDARLMLDEIREKMLLLFDDDVDEDQISREAPNEATHERTTCESPSSFTSDLVNANVSKMLPANEPAIEGKEPGEFSPISSGNDTTDPAISTQTQTASIPGPIARTSDRGAKCSIVSAMLTKIPCVELETLANAIAAEQEERLCSIRKTLKACDEKKKPLVSLQKLIYEFVEAFVMRELLLTAQLPGMELQTKSRLALRRSAYAALLLTLSATSPTISTGTFAKAYAREKRKRVAANAISLEQTEDTIIPSQGIEEEDPDKSPEGKTSKLSLPVLSLRPVSPTSSSPRKRILANGSDCASIRAAVFAHLSVLHEMAEAKGKKESNKTTLPISESPPFSPEEDNAPILMDHVTNSTQLMESAMHIEKESSFSDFSKSDMDLTQEMAPLESISPIMYLNHPPPLVHSAFLVTIPNSPASARLGEYRIYDSIVSESNENIKTFGTTIQFHGDEDKVCCVTKQALDDAPTSIEHPGSDILIENRIDDS